MKPPIKYVAELTQVRELSLLGTADLAYWTDRLAGENLTPLASEGQAQILISTTDSRYMGVKFKELCFAVVVRNQEPGAREDALYLVQAFNTSRFFTFVERHWFSTPYTHGSIAVDIRLPVSLRLLLGDEAVFQVAMTAEGATGSRTPVRCDDECWEGPIYLPGTGGGKGTTGRVFFARLAGLTRRYPFLGPGDKVTIEPRATHPALQGLREGGFAATEWFVRESATHARSKTYLRSTAGLS